MSHGKIYNGMEGASIGITIPIGTIYRARRNRLQMQCIQVRFFFGIHKNQGGCT